MRAISKAIYVSKLYQIAVAVSIYSDVYCKGKL